MLSPFSEFFLCFCRSLCAIFFSFSLCFSFPSLSVLPSYTTFLSSFLSSCPLYLLLYDKLLTSHVYLLLNYFNFSLLIFHFLPPIQTFFMLTLPTFCLKLAPNINTRCLHNTFITKEQPAVLGLLIPSPANYECEEKD